MLRTLEKPLAHVRNVVFGIPEEGEDFLVLPIKTTIKIPENLLNFRSVLVKSGFPRCKVSLATSLVNRSDCIC